MDIIEILLFVALVAVIFGVSMHEAFWGIMAFIGGAILFAIAKLFIEAYIERINKKIAYNKTPAGKAARKAKQQNIIGGLFSGIVVFLLFAPLLIGIFITLVFKDFSSNYPLATLIISVAPTLITIITFALTDKKRTK